MRIFLRPIELRDGAKIVKWRNSDKVKKHCFGKEPITIESNRAFFKRNIETGLYKQFMVERIEELSGVTSYPIATVYLKDMDLANRRCELCIFTSDDEEWNTESQKMAIEMLLKKAFEDYCMHKVYSYVFTSHQDEILLFKNAGFYEEAILKDEGVGVTGNYMDVARMAIFSNRD